MSAINSLDPSQSKIRDVATAGLGKHAGIVVGILRGGDQCVAGYGSFDAGQQPPGEDAIFEIGSVAKVFTTLLPAEMVLRGEVALDDRQRGGGERAGLHGGIPRTNRQQWSASVAVQDLNLADIFLELHHG